MKRKLILFYYPNKKFSLKKEEISFLKKKYSEIILFKNSFKNDLYEYNRDNRIVDIKNKYSKLGINLDIKKIYQINTFLKKNITKNKKKNLKIFVSSYFISSVFLEEEFIFYELSNIYKIQFLRPELSFFKNRYLLARNIFKQPYNIKKKTNFSKKDYNLFKTNYLLSMQNFSERAPNKIRFLLFKKILLNFLGFLFNFRFNQMPKKYILVILNNNNQLNKLSIITELKSLNNSVLNKFNYQLVFLLHPFTDPLNFLFKKMKNNEFFFQNKRVVIIHKPNKLENIIKNSKFIVHLTSSLSAQTLLLNKKILCLGKNIIYIKNLKNVVSNISQNNLKFLNKKEDKKNNAEINKFLINYLSNTVNSRGKFILSTKTKSYTKNSRPKDINKYDRIIIQNLLNVI